MEGQMRLPKLVASTGSTYCCSIAETKLQHARSLNTSATAAQQVTKSTTDEEPTESNFFKSVSWSPDGTCLFASGADNALRTFVVPTDILSASNTSALPLTPYTTSYSPEPVYSCAAYPHFNLSDPSTTLLLTTHRDHPIRLTNVLDPTSTILSTYSLINPTTEAYQTPHSLQFTPPGTQFLAGTDCLVALFDLSRNGEGPVTRLPTIPSKRHKMKGGGVGMRGIVSALSLQPTAGGYEENSMLAAGTWTRWVGLYDAGGMGGTVATWDVTSAADEEATIGGAGVSQVCWSSCGRYLVVAERKSRGCLVYDVRVTGKLVAWCEGREADTNQRLGVDVFGAADGSGASEVWAGGTDGNVRIWEGLGMSEGACIPDWSWKAHSDTVTTAAVHPSGTVVMTSSGQRRELGQDINDSDDSDSCVDESEEETDDETDTYVATDSTGSTSITSRSAADTPYIDNSVKLWSLVAEEYES